MNRKLIVVGIVVAALVACRLRSRHAASTTDTEPFDWADVPDDEDDEDDDEDDDDDVDPDVRSTAETRS